MTKRLLFLLWLVLIAPVALGPVLIAVHVLGALPVVVAALILIALRVWWTLRRRQATSPAPVGVEGFDRYSSTSGGLL